MKKLFLFYLFSSNLIAYSATVYQFFDEAALRTIIGDAEKKYGDVVSKGKLPKRLANKFLVLHKDITSVRKAAEKAEVKDVATSQTLTPCSLERRIRIAVFFAYKKDRRRAAITTSLMQSILENYRDAYREFNFLKDNKIAEFSYEKNPERYQDDYDTWLHFQLEPR
jgi:hypothetical protein